MLIHEHVQQLIKKVASLASAPGGSGTPVYPTLAAAGAAGLTMPASVFISETGQYYDLTSEGFKPRVYSE